MAKGILIGLGMVVLGGIVLGLLDWWREEMEERRTGKRDE